MSYDLIFYFPSPPSKIPIPRRRDSGITIDGPRAFDPEDGSDSLRRLLAKCRQCLTICCTGGRENFDDMERMKRELLESNDGVVLIDHQVGMALVEGKAISLAPVKPKEPDASISVYFENGTYFEEHSFASFLDLLQDHIPKALPYRYGPAEPLQFRLKEHGLGHFQTQWRHNPALAWQPSAPFKWVHTFIRNDRRDTTSRHGPRIALSCDTIDVHSSQFLVTLNCATTWHTEIGARLSGCSGHTYQRFLLRDQNRLAGYGMVVARYPTRQTHRRRSRASLLGELTCVHGNLPAAGCDTPTFFKFPGPDD